MVHFFGVFLHLMEIKLSRYILIDIILHIYVSLYDLTLMAILIEKDMSIIHIEPYIH